MKTLLTAALSATLALGCASGSGRERADDYGDWSAEVRTIGVAVVAPLPEAVLLTDERHLARDTLAGAGSGAVAGAGTSLFVGCYLLTELDEVLDSGTADDGGVFVAMLALLPCAIGIYAMPYAAAVGSVVGGAGGAAGSEPVETPYPLDEFGRLREAAALLQVTLERHDAGEMIVAALTDAIDGRLPHAARRDPRAAGRAAEADFEALHARMVGGDIDGLLVVEPTALGFRHSGVLDAEAPDPGLAFVLAARATVYFPRGECLKKAVFPGVRHEGPDYPLSRLEFDDGALASRELRTAIAEVADDLVSRVFHSGDPEYEKYVPGVGPAIVARPSSVARPRTAPARC